MYDSFAFESRNRVLCRGYRWFCVICLAFFKSKIAFFGVFLWKGWKIVTVWANDQEKKPSSNMHVLCYDACMLGDDVICFYRAVICGEGHSLDFHDRFTRCP